MKLCNVTENVVIVGTAQSDFHALLKPGQSIVMDDSMVDDAVISSMIESGWLMPLKAGQKVPTSNKPAKKAQNAFTLIKDQEVNMGGRDGKSVSYFQPGETADSVAGDAMPDVVIKKFGSKPVNSKPTAPRPLPANKAVSEEVPDGSLLIRMGNKGSKPVKIVKVSAAQAEVQTGQKTTIIKNRSTSKELNLDTGDMGSLFINPSGIPGQGKMVNIRDLSDSAMEAIAESTKQKLREAAQERKQIRLLNGYQDMEPEKRKEYIESFEDVDSQMLMLRLERSPALQMKIKGRLRALGVALADKSKPAVAQPKKSNKFAKKPAKVAPKVEVEEESDAA